MPGIHKGTRGGREGGRWRKKVKAELSLGGVNEGGRGDCGWLIRRMHWGMQMVAMPAGTFLPVHFQRPARQKDEAQLKV